MKRLKLVLVFALFTVGCASSRAWNPRTGYVAGFHDVKGNCWAVYINADGSVNKVVRIADLESGAMGNEEE